MATRHMTAGRIKPSLDRTGRESGSFQYVREAYKNAEEAQAQNVRIRWEQGASRHAIYRFEIADDGMSMTADELPGFINKFGGGGKPIGEEHENYGVGLKTSSLPWNKYGVLVAARKDGKTHIVVLHLDDKADEYGLKQWPAQSDGGEIELLDVLPIAEHVDGKWEPTVDRDFEPVKGTRVRDILDAFIHDEHGTVIVLCGDTGEEDTFLAEGGGGKMGKCGHTQVATYLEQRFDRLPINVMVEEPKAGDKSTWPQSPDQYAASHINKAGNEDYRVKTRNCRGVGVFLREGGPHGKKRPVHQGVFSLPDGTKVHWFLLPEGERYDGKGVGGVYWTPKICILYKGEIYYGSGVSDRQRFRTFGIVRNQIIDRCSIVLEPPWHGDKQPGVYPDSSRSRLIWTGGQGLPWTRWSDEFRKNMPDEIQLALDKATEQLGRVDEGGELTEGQKKRLKALTKRIDSSWFRKARSKDSASTVQVVRVVAVGTGGGRARGGGGGGGGGRGQRGGDKEGSREGTDPRYVTDPDGTVMQVVTVKRPDRLPKCRWLPASEFDNEQLIARWNEPEFAVDANLACPIIRESIDYWTAQAPTVDPDNIVTAVKKVYGLKLRTAVAHMLAAKRRGVIGPDDLENALSPLGLTMAASGFVIEDLALHGDIGALAGRTKARSNRPAATVFKDGGNASVD